MVPLYLNDPPKMVHRSTEDAMYTREDLLSEMQASEIGRNTIHRIAYSDVKIRMINQVQMFSYRGEQHGNMINIYLSNIKIGELEHKR